jgi:hypothetical protein
MILDLSTMGVGLLLRGSLPPGKVFTLHMGPRDQSPLQLSARVVYCTEQPNNASLAGCEFLAPLNEKDVQRLLAT